MKHAVVGKYAALMPAIQKISLLISEFMTHHEGGDVHAVFDIDDTLIFDDNRETPNVQVKHLLELSKAYGCKVHLVTAREKSRDVLRWTRAELQRHGIQYDSLALAPKKMRTSMRDIATFKHSERESKKPVVVTVGDQWGDLIQLTSEDDIEKLDTLHKSAETPWILIRPKDGISEYGVKLIANH